MDITSGIRRRGGAYLRDYTWGSHSLDHAPFW
jgi:hypothetical protein